MADYLIRTATPDDVAGMAEADAASWPPELASSAGQIAARIAAFPEGQLAAIRDGRVVGAVYAQRLDAGFFAGPKTFRRLTDDGRFTATHDDEGEICQLIGVSVLPSERGSGLGRRLVDRGIDMARRLPGVRRIVGFTRPAGYHRRAELPIDEYVRLRDNSGRLVDAVLAFHDDAGARIVSTHADYRPEDVQTRGYGVLIEYATSDRSPAR